MDYVLQNAHGDIIMIVDENANILNEYSYDAFGSLLTCKEKVANRFKYAGEQYDALTNEYYLRVRYYNPVEGRFTQEDTYRGDGLNLYAYVANNSIKYIDPTGYASSKCKASNNKTLGQQLVDNNYFIKELKLTSKQKSDLAKKT